MLFDPAIDYFAELEADNTKAFFDRERARYDVLRDTFGEVCARVSDFGAWRVYRPHNDRRFRKDADPYKTFLGAVAERPDGVGAFVQVSAQGVLVGTGMPMPARDQLPRLRAAIVDDVGGDALVRAIDHATEAGASVHGGRWPALKRVPSGYPTDCPRGDLLRWKGIESNTRVPRPQWRDVDEAAGAVRDLLRVPTELHDWLGRYVGPSTMTPEERFAPRGASKGR